MTKQIDYLSKALNCLGRRRDTISKRGKMVDDVTYYAKFNKIDFMFSEKSVWRNHEP
jgi:hypothetical protein